MYKTYIVDAHKYIITALSDSYDSWVDDDDDDVDAPDDDDDVDDEDGDDGTMMVISYSGKYPRHWKLDWERGWLESKLFLALESFYDAVDINGGDDGNE